MHDLVLLCRLTYKSIWNRKFTAGLTVLSIAVSILLLIAVETVRTETRSSFANTISGTDLIVGARSGSVQLLLYSVFRIGNATNNIDWNSYQEIASHPSVAWSIPISLGDSHRGYRVMGTTRDYFTHYRFAREQQLGFSAGAPFSGVYEAVIGAEVAKSLGYAVGEKITLAHGLTDTSFSRHDDKPFTVVGVLNQTGTPVDRTIHVSLEGIEALHIDWQTGTRSRNAVSAQEAMEMDLQPKQITAFMLGLKSKMTIFKFQRAVNNYRKEPLLAILPGVALGELWQLIGVAEKALLAVTLFVVFNSLVGLLTVILTSLNERRREIAILRSMGCRPSQVFALLTIESLLLAFAGCLFGVTLFYALILFAQPLLQQQFGLFISISLLGNYELMILSAILAISLVIGFLPGYRAYRYSLVDGMSIRL
jgi:putative ABC transport system permease protein